MKRHNFHLEEPDRSLVYEFLRNSSQVYGQEQGIGQIINEWARFTHAILIGYEDNIYEYTNDLFVRDILQNILSFLSPIGQEQLKGVIKESDEKYLAATTKTDKSLLPNKDPALWWWFRIPKSLDKEFRQYLDGD